MPHKNPPGCTGSFMTYYHLHKAKSGGMHLVDQRSGKRVGVKRAMEDSHGGIFVWPVGGGCYYLMDDEIERERDEYI